MSTVRSELHTEGASLARLFHYRWALPLLAELHRGQGAKQVTLLRRLEIGRSTLKRTLDALMELGLILPNPGHGHPMRPELVLSPAGKLLGPASQSLMRALERAQLVEIALRKWSMPVVHTLSVQARRYGELQRELPSSNPRALTRTLKDLCEAKLIKRSILNDFPPVPLYTASSRRPAIIRSVGELAQGLELDL